ncbi:MAG: aromatic ring-hydroxylating dioxygenase subunit alpha [Sphingobium sp.]
MNKVATILSSDETFTETCGMGHDPVPLEPYRSEEYFKRERDMIFRRCWLIMGREEEIPNINDYIVREIEATGSSIIISRGKDGTVRSFHNTCSHRGSLVEYEPKGTKSRFICPYHHWSYATDGRLLGVPDERSFHGLDKKKCGLSTIATETWEGWIFINLSSEPEVTLDEYLGDFKPFFSGWHYHAVQTPFHVRADLDANWKVILDAFIENYHIGPIHPNTIGKTFVSKDNPFSSLLDAKVFGPHRFVSMFGNSEYSIDDNALVEQLAYASNTTGSTIAASSGDSVVKFLAHPSVNPTGARDWSMDVNNIFPNTQIDSGPGGFWYHQFWPTSHNTTRYEARFYVPPASTVRERFQQEMYVARLVEVLVEDLINVARTQKGIETSGKDSMQLQDNEVGIRHSVEQVEKFVNAPTLREALSL